MSSNAAERSFVFAGLAIVAATYGLARYAYGLFLPDMRADFAMSSSLAGGVAAVSYGGYLVATLAGSAMSGAVGPRLPVVLGGAAATIGMALIAAADDVWTLALGAFVAGASPGLAYPPLSDATLRLVAQPRQGRAYAVVNSGTSAGVVLAGPLALWAGADWRLAWAAFAVFALAATLWNAKLLPSGPFGGDAAKLPKLRPRWFARRGSGMLFAAAAVFGAATSVYWTFAVDFLERAAGMSADAGRAFWVVIGVAGFIGAMAGDAARRFGLRAAFRMSALSFPAAVGLLLLAGVGADGNAGNAGSAGGWEWAGGWVGWEWEWVGVGVSGVLFGGGFILTTGLFGLWSMRLFPDRPSAGFGATFFLISAGQLLGPPLGGYCADEFGLTATFLATLAVGVVSAALGPGKETEK